MCISGPAVISALAPAFMSVYVCFGRRRRRRLPKASAHQHTANQLLILGDQCKRRAEEDA